MNNNNRILFIILGSEKVAISFGRYFFSFLRLQAVALCEVGFDSFLTENLGVVFVCLRTFKTCVEKFRYGFYPRASNKITAFALKSPPFGGYGS